MVKINQQSYTYLIKFIPTGQLYYGVRWGNKVAPEEDLWKKYFTSSKYIKKLINDYGPECFEYQIRRVFNNKDKARLWEETVLKRMKVVEKDVWLNKTDNHSILNTNDSWNKIKKTNLKKYGVKNVFASEEIKQKIIKINLEKFGVERPAKTDECKNKTKSTCMDRYGVNYYTQSEDYKNKYKETVVNKYGVKHYSQSNEFLEKTVKTNLERYGVKNYTQTKEYKIKTKETCLKKYGVENPAQSEVARKKFRQKYQCVECKFISNKGNVAKHQNKTGHKNFYKVEEEV